MTRWRLSRVNLIPLRIHFMTDVLIGIVCIAAPFLLGFSDETAPLIFLLVMGVGVYGAAFRDGLGASRRARGRAPAAQRSGTALRLTGEHEHGRRDPHAP